MSKVIVHRHVVKYLQRLPREAKDRIKDILKHLEKDPLNHPNIRKMAGEWSGYYRIRSANLRIIFWYDKKDDVVYIDYIGPRGDVYK